MRKERQAILHLVAAGRLTGAEAERLLILSNEGREWIWFAVLAAALCVMQAGPALWSASARFLHEILPGVIPALQAAASALGSHSGGGLL
jgi:hypothetical protein